MARSGLAPRTSRAHRGKERLKQRARMTVATARSLLVFLIFLASGSLALGQAGSTGGTIGKQDKSISGGEEAPSPSARNKQPAKPKEGTGSACGRIAASIAGTWNSSSPSSESEDIRQTGCNFVATLSNRFFNHAINGRYLDGSNFSLTVARTNRMTGCTTVMSGSMTVVSAAQMQWIITRTDGKCDLPANYHETRTWTR
jgi:hypothetical protein